MVNFSNCEDCESVKKRLRERFAPEGNEKRKVVSWQCGGEGHIKRDCTKRKPAWRGLWNKLDTTIVSESTKVQKPSVEVQGRGVY